MKLTITRVSNSAKFEYIALLEEGYRRACNPKWWQRSRSVDEIQRMCRLIADARAEYWAGLYQEHPQTRRGVWFGNERFVWQEGSADAVPEPERDDSGEHS